MFLKSKNVSGNPFNNWGNVRMYFEEKTFLKCQFLKIRDILGHISIVRTWRHVMTCPSMFEVKLRFWVKVKIGFILVRYITVYYTTIKSN